jgi:hypothetical protein
VKRKMEEEKRNKERKKYRKKWNEEMKEQRWKHLMEKRKKENKEK